MTDEAALRLFCRNVALTWCAHRSHGYPASLVELRQYVNARSDTYFWRIARTVDESLTELELKLSNWENGQRWGRLCRLRVVGTELEAIPRMIEALQLERLLIEHAFSSSAFRFGSNVEAVAASASG